MRGVSTLSTHESSTRVRGSTLSTFHRPSCGHRSSNCTSLVDSCKSSTWFFWTVTLFQGSLSSDLQRYSKRDQSCKWGLESPNTSRPRSICQGGQASSWAPRQGLRFLYARELHSLICGESRVYLDFPRYCHSRCQCLRSHSLCLNP